MARQPGTARRSHARLPAEPGPLFYFVSPVGPVSKGHRSLNDLLILIKPQSGISEPA